MIALEEYISPFVESQFPAFYQEEGPLFVLFVKEYFKWLESSNQTVYQSRKLPSYRDIDQTVDTFLIHFKEKYFSGVNLESYVSKKKLIKASLDIFRSKGTDRSIDLLLKAAFGASATVYTPGDDILKPSDGTWVVPKYLELNKSSKTPTFVGKQITGSKSGASAFVEYLITRTVNGKVIDLIFISNLEGDFSTDDIITTDGIIDGAPRVTGSLSSLDITTSGQNFIVGEIVNLISSNGVEGKARVKSISSETGLVSFAILDGGWGYSLTSNTSVSTKVISVSNTINSNASITEFSKYEVLSQNLYNLAVNNNIGAFTVGDILTNSSNSTATIVKVVQAGSSNTANLTINPTSGNTFANNIVYVQNKSYIATNTAVSFSAGDLIRQRTGSSNTAVGLVESISSGVILTVNTSVSISSNGLHVGNYVQQATTNATGTIVMLPREDAFNYTGITKLVLANTTGTFSNNDVINTYTDDTKVTYIANATPEASISGYIYRLTETSGTSRWSTSNTVLNSAIPTINTSILIASDIGGTYSSNADITATGTIIGSNSVAVGVLNVNNTFYATNNSIVYGLTSNTFANSTSISSGTGADFNIGLIENTETVRLSNDLLNGNNEYSVNFSTVLLSGANSGYGYLTSVFIFDGGASYNNTNIVTFTGGNTGGGSYGAANASITTNTSGGIVTVTISANTGSGDYISTPSLSIVNSTGGSTGVGSGANLAPLFGYGFDKMPAGDASSRILNLLSYTNKTIGKIVSLSNINPGENYNIQPFVIVQEPLVSALGKRDYILLVNNISGGATFSIGETITQTINSSAITITSNNYVGGNTNYEVGEAVTVYNGGSAVGNGVVYSSTYNTSSNTYTVVVTSNNGAFTNNYILFGETSYSNTTIIDSDPYTASATASGRVSSIVANTTVYVARESLYSDFTTGGSIAGTTSGVTATIVAVQENEDNDVIGDNAVISANVVTSNGAISELDIVSSGIGYVEDETVTVTSTDETKTASAKVNLIKQGIGEGFYSSTRGFLDNNKFIHDGYYYQEYSYEVRSSIPFERYDELLKQLLHVSGTKMFGKLVTSSVVNTNITVISNIETS